MELQVFSKALTSEILHILKSSPVTFFADKVRKSCITSSNRFRAQNSFQFIGNKCFGWQLQIPNYHTQKLITVRSRCGRSAARCMAVWWWRGGGGEQARERSGSSWDAPHEYLNKFSKGISHTDETSYGWRHNVP